MERSRAALEVIRGLLNAGLTDEQAQRIMQDVVRYTESRCRLSFVQGYREGMKFATDCDDSGIQLITFDIGEQ